MVSAIELALINLALTGAGVESAKPRRCIFRVGRAYPEYSLAGVHRYALDLLLQKLNLFLFPLLLFAAANIYRSGWKESVCENKGASLMTLAAPALKPNKLQSTLIKRNKNDTVSRLIIRAPRASISQISCLALLFLTRSFGAEAEAEAAMSGLSLLLTPFAAGERLICPVQTTGITHHTLFRAHQPSNKRKCATERERQGRRTLYLEWASSSYRQGMWIPLFRVRKSRLYLTHLSGKNS